MEIEGEIVTIGGMCKGSGMINPDMATLLGVLTCDAPVKPSVWKEMLVEAMDLSFNRVKPQTPFPNVYLNDSDYGRWRYEHE